MSITERTTAMANLKKKRGFTKGSITRMRKRLLELEAAPNSPGVLDHITQMLKRIKTWDDDFHDIHRDLIEYIDTDDVEEMEREDDVMGRHEETVDNLTIRLQQLAAKVKPPPKSIDPSTAIAKRLGHLKRELSDVEHTLSAISEDHDDPHFLQQHLEQLSDHKEELSKLFGELVILDLEDEHELMTLHAELKKLRFDCAHRALCLLNPTSAHAESITSIESAGELTAKLPRLSIPTFDGDILKWPTFWSQFEVSVHNHAKLTEAEKLAYLRQALQEGPASQTIEGLSTLGNKYSEAIKCLKERFDQPREVHQLHVKALLDLPRMRDNSGKEVRRVHDTSKQHIRALVSLGYDLEPAFMTALIQTKLDPATSFEWKKHSSEKAREVPHYDEILHFLDMTARASSEAVMTKKEVTSGKKYTHSPRPVTSHAATANNNAHCILCPKEKHPLYGCSKFKALSQEEKRSLLKRNQMCFNCLRSGHYLSQCESSHRCKRCQKPHHTLLHMDSTSSTVVSSNVTPQDLSPTVVSNTAVRLCSGTTLLMTCKLIVYAPDGSITEARALLDNGSSASFVSERLAQVLRLPRHKQSMQLSGITGTPLASPPHVTNFKISPVHCTGRKIHIAAIVVPKVTRELPVHTIPLDPSWTHLSKLKLADPSFGQPGRIDVLLGVDVFLSILRQGRRTGPAGAPVAMETEFGWVLGGSVSPVPVSDHVSYHVTACYASIVQDDDILRRFWELEEPPKTTVPFTLEEKNVMHHFKQNHTRTSEGRFVVPLPRRVDTGHIGETRSQAVRRFLSLESSLHKKGKFSQVDQVIQEYLYLQHAEPVPAEDLKKEPSQVFYLPMQVVYKASSSTTKVRAVFDASAKSSTGVSLNDTLLIGPTVHSTLVEVLLRFRTHKIALTTDISKMYRAIQLAPIDKDYHRFVWRNHPDQKLIDYRMTRATFGVSASCFAANMSVRQNAADYSHLYPLAAHVAETSFYVDDCLTGADSCQSAVSLRERLQELFNLGCFTLRKWNSSDPAVLETVPPDLRDPESVLSLPESDQALPKTLGIQWNAKTDCFHVCIAKASPPSYITKRELASDIAKVFDALGWIAPATITMKILLQKTWESKVGWDDLVPEDIRDTWSRWRSEIHLLADKAIPRCYFPKRSKNASIELHGFGDASEVAYGAVVYLRSVDTTGAIHISLVISKTKVAPLKRQTIPRLELCGAVLVANLLDLTRQALDVPISKTFAWTDSTIVLCWLSGSPKRFKTFVGNRISEILDKIPPDRWNHVASEQNPADCASRGLLPSELLEHQLWWTGPPWLWLFSTQWPVQDRPCVELPSEERLTCLATISLTQGPVIEFRRFSSFLKLTRVLGWVLRFISQARKQLTNRPAQGCQNHLVPFTVEELAKSESILIKQAQSEMFMEEITRLKEGRLLQRSSNLVSLLPFLDEEGVLRVGGRLQRANLPWSRKHPYILHGSHPLARLIIRAEHLKLLHAGPSLVNSSLSTRIHLIGAKNAIHSVTKGCIICRRISAKTQAPQMGQLPPERVNPGSIFDKTGVDYAGPLLLKLGHTRKPTVVKAYICLFISLAVKAVHLEAVSELTTEAFIAALRRFVSRRGCPSLIISDNGTNFIGAHKELEKLWKFLNMSSTSSAVADCCSSMGIQWKFIPERSPHFGGLWEAAVKSTKNHLRRVVGDVKLTFEELTTILTQIEACLNSRPLVAICSDPDRPEVLTPGHFLIGKPLCSIPDPKSAKKSITLLKRWELCQNLTQHFWERWSSDYLRTLNKAYKWQNPGRNLKIGDMVVLKEDGAFRNKWPLGRIIQTYPGKDGHVRVALVKTAVGTYRRPVVKLAPLLGCFEKTSGLGRRDVEDP